MSRGGAYSKGNTVLGANRAMKLTDNRQHHLDIPQSLDHWMGTRFVYDSPEMEHMLEARVLRVWDHEHLDSCLNDYVRGEPYERTAFEQRHFRIIWEHRTGPWNWENKQPTAKQNPDYHLVHQACRTFFLHHTSSSFFTNAGSQEVLP